MTRKIPFIIATIFFLSQVSFAYTPIKDTVYLNFDKYIKKQDKGDAQKAASRLFRSISKKKFAGKHIKISINKGEYDFFPDAMESIKCHISNHDHEDSRKVAFKLSELKSVEIDGNGSKFIFHGRLIPFLIDSCRNISIKNLVVDNKCPALTQIRIVKKHDDGHLTAKILDETNFEIRNGKLVVKGYNFENTVCSAMPFKADRHMAYGKADIVFNPGKLTNTGKEIGIFDWKENASEGDVYVLRSWYRPCPGIVVNESSDIKFSNITLRYAEGMGLIAQHSGDINLEGFKVEADRNSGRYFTLQADATHFSGCKGLIKSVGGVYEHMADDAINVHGTYLKVEKFMDDRTVKVSFAHSQSFGYKWSSEGDSMAFINRENLEEVFRTAVIKDCPADDSGKNKILEMADPVPENIKNMSLVAENLEDYPEVYFCDNIIRNNRARGTLFSTRKTVTCKGNIFDHTHGSAILLCGDAGGWYESGPCSEVIIENNIFINPLTAMYQFTDAIISICPQIKKIGTIPYHGNIIISNNTFNTFPSPLISASSCNSIIWKNNKIVHNNDYPQLMKNLGSNLRFVQKVSFE